MKSKSAKHVLSKKRVANVTTEPMAPEPLPRLYGLVLAGGHSTRMGQDKSGLVYHDRAQLNHAVSLVSGFTQKVYVSARPNQSELELYAGHELIQDNPDNGEGPVNGVLSAMKTHPDAAWLVLACDMPLVGETELGELVAGRRQDHSAVAYVGEDENPEPLCTIYEPVMMERLSQRVEAGRYGLRRALTGKDICLLTVNRLDRLINANTVDEMNQVHSALARKDTKGMSL